MLKPGLDEAKRVWVWRDKLSYLLPRKVCAISENGERHYMSTGASGRVCGEEDVR